MSKHSVGTVQELWRYPVKSMEGEALQKAQLEKLGMVGDRYWAIKDISSNELTTVRKSPKLLKLSACYESEPRAGTLGESVAPVKITIPEIGSFSSNDASLNAHLSNYFKKEISLHPLQPKSNWRFYKLKTISGEKALKKQFYSKEALPSLGSISWSKLIELSFFATPRGRFYDVYPLHLITSNSTRTLESLVPEGDFQPKRFRPNIYIHSNEENEQLDEFEWVGGRLHIGETIIKCESKTVRCLMPAQPQPGIEKDTHVLRALDKYTERHYGINATIIKQGNISIGDTVYWEPESRFSLRRFFEPLSHRLKNIMIKSNLKLIDKISGK